MWLSLAFLSAALLGLYDVAKKYSLRENAVIPVLFCNTLFCALIFLPFIVASHTGILGSESLLCVDNWQWHEQRFIGVSRNLVGINFRHPNVMPNFAVWKTITYRHWHRWCCQPRF